MTLPQSSAANTAAIISSQSPVNIAVIGAGLTGLITADLLEQVFNHQSKPVIISIYEKSAGVGRLATRYQTPPSDSSGSKSGNKQSQDKQWQFDFGAQFFTAKTTDFQSYLQPWLDKGVIEPWQATVAKISSSELQDLPALSAENLNLTQWDVTQPRYISSPKMTTWGRAIAKSLSNSSIHHKTRVAPFTQSAVNNAKTTLFDTDNNELGVFDWVICTVPQGQAIEMVEDTDFTYKDAIKTPTMLACYTLMLGWMSVADMPAALQHATWSVLQINNQGGGSVSSLLPLGKVFIEHHKPNRDHILPSVTIHADNTWAQTHVDDDINAIKIQLIQAAQFLLQWDDTTAPTHVDCHCWRYAATVPADKTDSKSTSGSQPSLAYVDNGKQWILTGDWCHEGRIESCFVVAQQVVNVIKDNMRR